MKTLVVDGIEKSSPELSDMSTAIDELKIDKIENLMLEGPEGYYLKLSKNVKGQMVLRYRYGSDDIIYEAHVSYTYEEEGVLRVFEHFLQEGDDWDFGFNWSQINLVPRYRHYDWMEADVTCEECGWEGNGYETLLSDVFMDYQGFADGGNYICPTSCGNLLAKAYFSTVEEKLKDVRAKDIKYRSEGLFLDSMAKYALTSLKGPSQLPDIDPSPETLKLSCSTSPNWQSWYVIHSEGKEIWREYSFFEDYSRFRELAKILRQKYGYGLKDLELTRGAWGNLYGDAIGAAWGGGVIEEVREALAKGLPL